MLVRLLALAAALWCIGFLVFIFQLPDAESTVPVKAGEGIVVPTGGSSRLVAGLALMGATDARLLITGVYPATDIDALSAQIGRPIDKSRVDLDRAAADTVGNANAAALWAKQHGIVIVHLVTSWYHMPRSLLLFERSMPGITIIPHPVFSDELPRDGWWFSLHAWRLIIAEYMKLLWSWTSQWRAA